MPPWVRSICSVVLLAKTIASLWAWMYSLYLGEGARMIAGVPGLLSAIYLFLAVLGVSLLAVLNWGWINGLRPSTKFRSLSGGIDQLLKDFDEAEMDPVKAKRVYSPGKQYILVATALKDLGVKLYDPTVMLCLWPTLGALSELGDIKKAKRLFYDGSGPNFKPGPTRWSVLLRLKKCVRYE